MVSVCVCCCRYDNRVENKKAATTSFRRGSSALYSKHKTTVSRTKRAVDSSDSLEYEVENKYVITVITVSLFLLRARKGKVPF